MLIYIISLTLQSAIDVTINNQCTTIALISPVYFVKDATCHIQFPRQVNTNRIMRATFITGIDRDTFGGALLYNLQRKENASISAQLLVIWGYKYNRIYSHTQLIEHESTFTWDENKLEKLYGVYSIRYDPGSSMNEWLLDDNTVLKTVCESSHGGFKMEVIIFEEKEQLHPTKPLWIDTKR
jgi:hypothetical protein